MFKFWYFVFCEHSPGCKNSRALESFDRRILRIWYWASSRFTQWYFQQSDLNRSFFSFICQWKTENERVICNFIKVKKKKNEKAFSAYSIKEPCLLSCFAQLTNLSIIISFRNTNKMEPMHKLFMRVKWDNYYSVLSKMLAALCLYCFLIFITCLKDVFCLGIWHLSLTWVNRTMLCVCV